MRSSSYHRPLTQAALIWMCLAALSFAQESPELPTMDALRLEFDIQRQKLREPVETLKTLYDSQLANLEETASQSGDLDLLVAVQTERKGFPGGQTREVDAQFSKLREIQGIYRKELEKREAAYAEKLAPLAAKYDAQLEALELALTREKRVEEALKVRAARDEIPDLLKQTAEVASADGDSAPSPGKFHGITAGFSGKPQFELAAEYSDIVSLHVGFRAWAAIRSNGQVISSVPWLNEIKDAEDVVFDLSLYADTAWVVREGGRIESKDDRGPDGLRSAKSFYHCKLGHGAAVDEDGELKVWGPLFESKDEYEEPAEEVTNAIQVIASGASKNFRAYALLEDGGLVSWGHKATKHFIPEGEKFQAISTLGEGVMALTREGRAFLCTKDGATPFEPDRGPYVAIQSHNGIQAARKSDGSWVAKGASSQNAFLKKIAEIGPVGSIAFSNAVLIWTEAE